MKLCRDVADCLSEFFYFSPKTHAQGNYTLSSAEDVDEKFIFSGVENPLVYRRHHNIKFQCLFDMTFYPFDVQKCNMVFITNPNAGRFRLRKKSDEKDGGDPLNYLGERELMQYYVSRWALVAVTGT